MGSVPRRIGTAWALVLGLSISAGAQSEIVVKLAASSPPALQSALSGGLSKTAIAATAFAPLFDRSTPQGPLLRGRAEGSERPFGLERIFIVRVDDPTELEAALALWRGRADVEYAVPNGRLRLDLPVSGTLSPAGDAYLDSLGHLEVTRVTDAWSVTTGSPRVLIGFVDTGVWFEHPDLRGQFWVNPGEDLNGNGEIDAADLDGLDNDGNGFVDDLRGFDFVDREVAVELGDLRQADGDASEDLIPSIGPGRGHGTYIGGILGAARNNGLGIAGVAPDCRLVPLRAFANDGEGEDDDVARAIVYAADLGLDVLNLSFGDATYSPPVHDAIRYAVDAGTIVVASAGNDGGDWPHYPSDYPEVISVAWLSENGRDRGFRASHGANLDVGAPGTAVFTTLTPPGGRSGTSVPDSVLYGRRSGSSVAAPIVSGIAALLRALDEQLTPESVRAILAQTAVDIRDPGWDQWTGAGLVDAAAALGAAYPARVSIASPAGESGVTGPLVAVVGSALAPLFDGYELSYAIGDDEPDGRWIAFAQGSRQVAGDTLGVWDVTGLPDTTVVLRLAVHLKNGNTVEDRRRMFVDRSAPRVQVVAWDRAFAQGRAAVVAEVAIDDFSDARMVVEVDGRVETVHSDRSDRMGRRHGLLWVDQNGRGGAVTSRIEVTNAAGLSTVLEDRTFDLAAASPDVAAVERVALNVPSGYLMPDATDFDRDGLLEIVFNQYAENNLGDTLAYFEWGETDFRPMGRFPANVFPRSVGDTDGDGLKELLTQVSAVTLLLEQPDPRSIPTSVAFLDTTGIDDIDNDAAVWGTLLADLDGDGRAEILSHNRRQWRVLGNEGFRYPELFRLENPTDPDEARRSGEIGLEGNGFSLPRALVDDLDGDGFKEILVGDNDGDFLVFECGGASGCGSTWTYLTPRYNAGSRFASGDFDGDGRREFVTYTDGFRELRGDREYEAEYGIFYRFESEGDDTYVLRDSLLFAGPVSNQGTVQALDIEGDGIDELVVVYPPDLYVFKPASDWTIAYHWGDADRPHGSDSSVPRSIFVVTDDFDGDGVPEIVVAASDERMHLLDWSSVESMPAAPIWEHAFAQNDSTVVLSWYAPGADSVTVWRTTGEMDLDPLLTTTIDSLTLVSFETSAFALTGWSQGRRSAISAARRIRPHSPATLESLEPGPKGRLTVTFTEALDPRTSAASFRLSGAAFVRAVVLIRGGQGVSLESVGAPTKGDTLFWTGIWDAEASPIPDGFAVIQHDTRVTRDLALAEWRIVGPAIAELVFNKPLDGDEAVRSANYRVEPNGSVAAVAWSTGMSDRVQLTLEGRALGAIGRSTTLVVERMRAADGAELAPEGNVATFTAFAEDLRDVYPYPNPYRASTHGGSVTIAGLPRGAEITLFGSSGNRIRTLVETDGDGGVQWDLRDEGGSPVPSGVYIIRVEVGGLSPVIKKLAVVR